MSTAVSSHSAGYGSHGGSGSDAPLSTLAAEVQNACGRIAPHAVRTPTVRLPWLDTEHREVWAKLECWQVSGSFKARGALNALAGFEPGQMSVTASAGNHGLGVAFAARTLSQRTRVFVPTTASELKVRRIAAAGAQVTVVGRDLKEATDHAVEYARRHELPFISPYADWNVAAGQGTCMVEAVEDAGAFDTVVVPLGGGGLLSGVGAYAVEQSPGTRLIATHPEVFNRPFGQDSIDNCLRMATPPTYADGLAVQHTFANPLADVLERLLSEVRSVSENEIVLGIYALLHEHSLLVEGAAATTAAALLSGKAPEDTGRTLLVLSGGNISSSALARAIVAEVHDEHLRIGLGLRRNVPVLEKSEVAGLGEQLAKDHPRPGTAAGSPDSVPPNSRWAESSLSLNDADARAEDHQRYLEAVSLPKAKVAHEALDRLRDLADGLAQELRSPESGLPDVAPGAQEDVLRLLLRVRETLTNGLEWASPAYDQSRRVNFYDTSAQAAGGVNYARYGTNDLRTLELGLTDMLGLAHNGTELLATSSGMAAYQVIESLLLRHAVEPGDTIGYAPYIYFEAAEQLEGLRFLNHVRAERYDADLLVDMVEKHDAKVLFADPVNNVAGLPVVDLRRLAELTERREGWSDRWLVIDGTMVSGALNVFDLFNQPGHPQILYYESASKYAQFGLDLQMAGVCVVPSHLAAAARTIRRNTGTILYPDALARFPRADRGAYLNRMVQMSANARVIADVLRADPRIAEHILVGWVDDWRDRDWAHGGAVLTVEFRRAGLNNRDGLEAVIERMLGNARARGVPLVKGLSFGFSTTRISAASAMAQGSDPFLRFSVGTHAQEAIEQQAAAAADAVSEYLRTFDTPMSKA
ncbi:pyridoxal-phosphate dependent enzyme [Streptomyces drozdowiczii]|uniref:Pyridoxal-phosphate dependent enzyme n=1 Tax=Streptomyces drozdowiczii TaxID=202862 RepID=A0ABY6PPB7_9ACTN|nr:pyridoxal-phosphate dependent enzyme [Streptomyces drozdowiczii]MCX0246600.1 pyridoxal-phosphate dependent enzyme [Streptomyces drozdowiczii]UZK53921.1 pyridoxal-phosphate dependent enzyme [Streptomyces drozdowiczii]